MSSAQPQPVCGRSLSIFDQPFQVVFIFSAGMNFPSVLLSILLMFVRLYVIFCTFKFTTIKFQILLFLFTEGMCLFLILSSVLLSNS